MEKITLGFIENVTIEGTNGEKITVPARIDTGAQNSSISHELAAELHLGPILKNKVIRQSQGKSLRPIVKTQGNLCGRDFDEEFTISHRTHMRYKVLIGQNILRKGFLIDPNKYPAKK